MIFLPNVSRVMKHIKSHNPMKKQKFVKMTKGHVIITINFETRKIATLNYGEKSQKSDTFRVEHRGVKQHKSIIHRNSNAILSDLLSDSLLLNRSHNMYCFSSVKIMTLFLSFMPCNHEAKFLIP